MAVFCDKILPPISLSYPFHMRLHGCKKLISGKAAPFCSRYSHPVGVVEFPLAEERTTPAPDGAPPCMSGVG